MKNGLKIKGEVLIKVIEVATGKVLRVIKEKNLVVNVGLSILTNLLNNSAGGTQYISQVAFGTNGTTPTLTDTLITAQFLKAINSTTFPSDGVVEFHWTLETNEDNGASIQEFGLMCADGSLFARKVCSPAIAKTSAIRLDSKWTITIS